MNIEKSISYRYQGNNYQYEVNYSLETHDFAVVENAVRHFKLRVDRESKVWSVVEGDEPSIPLTTLSHLIQQSYGVFV